MVLTQIGMPEAAGIIGLSTGFPFISEIKNDNAKDFPLFIYVLKDQKIIDKAHYTFYWNYS